MNLEEIFKGIPPIQTERLLLRGHRPSDAKEVLAIYSDGEINQYNRWNLIETEKEASFKISDWRRKFDRMEQLRWAIDLEGKVIGDCGIVDLDPRSNRATIGFNLNRAFWRQGYMAEAVSAIITHTFTEFYAHRIDALVMPENTPSRNLLTKLGFVQEAVLKEYTSVRGKYADACVYAIFENDFSK